MAFPSIKDVLDELKDIRDGLDPEDGHETDVRLQVLDSDEWLLLSGDPQYDQDHRGYWGTDSVSADDTDAQLRAVAEDLIESAREDYESRG